jgi:hypothetical protein
VSRFPHEGDLEMGQGAHRKPVSGTLLGRRKQEGGGGCRRLSFLPLGSSHPPTFTNGSLDPLSSALTSRRA